MVLFYQRYKLWLLILRLIFLKRKTENQNFYYFKLKFDIFQTNFYTVFNIIFQSRVLFDNPSHLDKLLNTPWYTVPNNRRVYLNVHMTLLRMVNIVKNMLFLLVARTLCVLSQQYNRDGATTKILSLRCKVNDPNILLRCPEHQIGFKPVASGKPRKLKTCPTKIFAAKSVRILYAYIICMHNVFVMVKCLCEIGIPKSRYSKYFN